MSNQLQAMIYESLKEAIRQEFEDILEPEQTFLMGCLLIFVLALVFQTPWEIYTEINAPI